MTTTLHGVDVVEEYRWLEHASAEDTVAWTKAQQQLASTYFDAVPWRVTLRARVEELLKAPRTTFRRPVRPA